MLLALQDKQALSTTIISPCCSPKKSLLPSLTQICMQTTLILSTWPTSGNQLMTTNVTTRCFASLFSLVPWVRPTTTLAGLCPAETLVLIRGQKTLAQPRTIVTFWWQIYRIRHIVLPSSPVLPTKPRASSLWLTVDPLWEFPSAVPNLILHIKLLVISYLCFSFHDLHSCPSSLTPPT